MPWIKEGRSIGRWSSAEPPMDVAIGITDRCVTEGAFRPTGMSSKLWMCTVVWTAGYPDNAGMPLPFAKGYPTRGYHGYLTRRIPAGPWLGYHHGDLLELNFPVVLGMSGAP